MLCHISLKSDRLRDNQLIAVLPQELVCVQVPACMYLCICACVRVHVRVSVRVFVCMRVHAHHGLYL